MYKLDQVKKKDIYLLADGLNRCTTIVNYFKNPFEFENSLNLIEDIKNELVEKYKKAHKDFVLKDLCDKWFNIENFENYKQFVTEKIYKEKLDYLKKIIQRVIDKKDREDIYNFLLSKTNDLCAELNISKSIIGVIINDDIKTLPILFKRINQNGTPLLTCEVLAAKWCEKEIEIKNNDIVECIKNHYDEMQHENNEMDLHLVGSGKYTVYDYVNGLSRHLEKKYEDTFWGCIKDKEFTFKLLSCCLIGEISKKSFEKLDDILIKENLTKLENKIYWAIQFISDALDNIIIIKATKKDISIKYMLIKESSFFIGLLTYVFENKAKIDKQDEYYKKLIQINLLNDKLSNIGFNAKTIKVLVEDKKYMNNIDIDEFENNLEKYCSYNMAYTENKIKQLSYLILMYIRNIRNPYNTNSVEFGTIVSKKTINDYIKKKEEEQLSIYGLGNICIYDEEDTPKKYSECAYKYLSDHGSSDDEIYEKNILIDNCNTFDNIIMRNEISKKSYLKFLMYRMRCIKKILFDEYKSCMDDDYDENSDNESSDEESSDNESDIESDNESDSESDNESLESDVEIDNKDEDVKNNKIIKVKKIKNCKFLKK